MDRRPARRRPRARPYLHDVKHFLAAPRRRAGSGARHLAALLFRSVRFSVFDPPQPALLGDARHPRNSGDPGDPGDPGAIEDEDSDDGDAGFASRAYLGALEDEAAAYYVRAQQSGTTVIPLRVRPAFILFTALTLVVLALLGFHPNAQRWTLVNDKILHFACLFIATFLFYCIFDVDDRARKSSWFWRDAPLYLTLITCFIVGSVGSEIVQSMLPYKTFQWGDVVANLLGSSLGMLTSYRLEAHYRHRREIARLYHPIAMGARDGGLGGMFSSDEEGDDEEEAEDEDNDMEVLEMRRPHPNSVVLGLDAELDPVPPRLKPDKGKRRVRWGGVEHFEPPAPDLSYPPTPVRAPVRSTLFSLDNDEEDDTGKRDVDSIA